MEKILSYIRNAYRSQAGNERVQNTEWWLVTLVSSNAFVPATPNSYLLFQDTIDMGKHGPCLQI